METLCDYFSVLARDGQAFASAQALEKGACRESRLAASELNKARRAFFSVS